MGALVPRDAKVLNTRVPSCEKGARVWLRARSFPNSWPAQWPGLSLLLALDLPVLIFSWVGSDKSVRCYKAQCDRSWRGWRGRPDCAGSGLGWHILRRLWSYTLGFWPCSVPACTRLCRCPTLTSLPLVHFSPPQVYLVACALPATHIWTLLLPVDTFK